MYCTKCGKENPDEATACDGCGHKLRSAWAGGRENGEREERDGPLPLLRGAGPGSRRRLRLLAESWGVAGLVWLAAWFFLRFELAWALYPLAFADGAYAWMRGITWRD